MAVQTSTITPRTVRPAVHLPAQLLLAVLAAALVIAVTFVAGPGQRARRRLSLATTTPAADGCVIETS